MARTIEIQLTESSIKSAIAELKKYERDMRRKLNDLVTRLGQIGLSVINVRLTGWGYPGHNDVVVSTSFSGNTCTISASGQSVAFIEFGAGIYFPTGVYAGRAGADAHGTYGHGQGSNPAGWIYKGEQGDPSLAIPVPNKPGAWRTWGNDPANAFPLGVQEIQNSVNRVVHEVFG